MATRARPGASPRGPSGPCRGAEKDLANDQSKMANGTRGTNPQIPHPSLVIDHLSAARNDLGLTAPAADRRGGAEDLPRLRDDRADGATGVAAIARTKQKGARPHGRYPADN